MSFIDWFTSTKTKKESISKDLNDISVKSINDMFSKENLEKRENSEKLFSKDESIKKKVKEDFEKNLKARLNEDNQRYIKQDELKNYCNGEIKKKLHDFEKRLEKEEQIKIQKDREEENRQLNSRINR